MKRLLAFLLVFMTMLPMVANASMILEYNGKKHEYTGSLYDLEVNGEKVETPLEPIIFNGRALVPVKEVMTAMGAKVTYIDRTREVTVSLDDTYVVMQIDSPYVYINAEKHAIPDGVVPMLIAKEGESAKTMVPVRFVSESLGMKVEFDGENGVIRIDNPNQKKEEPEISYSSTVKSVKIGEEDEYTVVTVTLTAAPEKITSPVLIESSGVLYLDIYGADYTASNNILADVGAVAGVRLGQHEEYTRVAIDTEGIEDYYTRLSKNETVLKIYVSGTGEEDKDTENALPPEEQKPDGDEEIETPDSFLTGEKIVVIDAGHGGTDPGAVYSHDGIEYREKIINLAVAKKVRDILESKGVKVEMTRSGDTYPTLAERSDFANKLGAAMFVSIHSNSNENTSVSGLEVFYSKSNNSDRYTLTSKKLADDIYKNLIKATSASQRGVKTEEWYVTRTSEMPAVLIELGFITNQAEAQKLYTDEYRDTLAKAIADAILADLKIVKIPPDPKPVAEKSSLDEEEVSENVISEELFENENG